MRKIGWRWVTLAGWSGLAWAAYACSMSANYPPVTPEPTGTVLPGKFVWRDLLTSDPEAAQRFYGELFGWEFETFDDGERAIAIGFLAGNPIAGILDTRQRAADSVPAQWVSSLSVDDVEAASRRVRDEGGTLHWGPRTLGRRGLVALVSDPQRSVFALVRAPAGDPRDTTPVPNAWLWSELWTPDPDAAVRFYRRLAGYLANELHDGQRPYVVLEAAGEPRAGIAHLQNPRIRPNWLPYIRVTDVRATAARAEALGGRVLIRPSKEIRDGRVALIQDPTGAAVAVQEWEPARK
ncbi:MAG TPA: VOC family protein [Gemmatimonadaceae bacterium]|nr:VOC family protein [Gemmatimonadaceae bacterium]